MQLQKGNLKMADEKTRILDVNKGEKEKTPITAAPPEEDAAGGQFQPEDHLFGEYPDKRSGGSLSEASCNYINAIIGSGIIGIPFAIREAGLVLGLAGLCLVAWMTDYSMILMLKSGTIANTNSYQDLMAAAFGRVGFAILSVIQFFFPFVAMISYNVIVGDTASTVLTRIFGDSSDDGALAFLASREFAIVAATICVSLPLSLYKNISRLAKWSTLSIIFVLFLLLTVFVRLFTLSDDSTKRMILQDTEAGEESWKYFDLAGLPAAIGIVSLAFICHHNTFLLYCSIEEPTEHKWSRVTHVSVLSALVIMVAFAITGYATFGNATEGDILQNYCFSDNLMTVSRIFFTFTVLLTYPLECFVAREVVINAFLGKKISGEDDSNNETIHVVLTLAIVATVTAISFVTDCLGIVLELNGTLAAIPLAFVLPALCYVKLETETPIWSRQKLPAIFMASFGIGVSVLSLIKMISQGITDCAHGEEMLYCHASVNTTMRHI